MIDWSGFLSSLSGAVSSFLGLFIKDSSPESILAFMRVALIASIIFLFVTFLSRTAFIALAVSVGNDRKKKEYMSLKKTLTEYESDQREQERSKIDDEQDEGKYDETSRESDEQERLSTLIAYNAGAAYLYRLRTSLRPNINGMVLGTLCGALYAWFRYDTFEMPFFILLILTATFLGYRNALSRGRSADEDIRQIEREKREPVQ